jgi:hypothetical protein
MIKYIKNLWNMNTVREIIKSVMPYYHFEVTCTGKSGSPDISEFRISLLAETRVTASK